MKQTCYGTIGIDLNIDHMAVCETDDKGNVVNTKIYRFDLSKKTSNQRKAILQQSIKKCFDDVKARRKPIIIEELDFEQKKMEQLYKKKKYNAMLSTFAYAQIKEYIIRRFYRGGIEVICVDPRNTSQIGKEKYRKAKGMSIHMSASYVIARRGMGYKDTVT
ncbi:IS200/IS605 family accessory protein TnpB-related protein [Amedibacillus sp. YH-ame10]